MPDFYRPYTISLSSNGVDCIESALNPSKTSYTSPNQFCPTRVSRVAQLLTAWSSRRWPCTQLTQCDKCSMPSSLLALNIDSCQSIIHYWVTIHVKVFGSTKLNSFHFSPPWSNSLLDCTKYCLLLYIASSNVLYYRATKTPCNLH
jgi:hypothetical protein